MHTKRTIPTLENPSQCLLPIGHGKHTLIDAHNYAALSRYTWRARKSHSKLYVVRKIHHYGKTKTIFLHRQIMHPRPDQSVHHINSDTLDNREANLRNVTAAQHALIAAVKRISKLRPKSPDDQTFPHR